MLSFAVGLNGIGSFGFVFLTHFSFPPKCTAFDLRGGSLPRPACHVVPEVSAMSRLTACREKSFFALGLTWQSNRALPAASERRAKAVDIMPWRTVLRASLLFRWSHFSAMPPLRRRQPTASRSRSTCTWRAAITRTTTIITAIIRRSALSKTQCAVLCACRAAW